MFCKTLVGVSFLVMASAGFGGSGRVFGQEPPADGAVELGFFSGSTFNLQSSRAFVAVPGTVADSGQRKLLPLVGAHGGYWIRRYFGLYADASFVDGLKASAQVGANRSEVSSNVADFHGGLQFQYPGGRFRPYFNVGGGVARASMKSSMTLAGTSFADDSSATLGSIVYGGGLKVMFSQKLGARFGLDGMTVGRGGARANYGRFIAGLIWTSK